MEDNSDQYLLTGIVTLFFFLAVPLLFTFMNRGAKAYFAKINRFIRWTWGAFWLFLLCLGFDDEHDVFTILISLDLVILWVGVIIKLVMLIRYTPVKSNLDILDENML